MTLLDRSEIEDFVASASGWQTEGDSIIKTFEFSDFSHAMGFVARVAMAAEKADHHPDIDIRWNRVTLALSTHSAGGLTQKDVDLALTVDRFA